MYKAYDNNIMITRGDSAIFDLAVTDDRTNSPYTIQSTDYILFTVKTGTDAKQVSFQKQVVDGQVIIDPKDTSPLDYGEYVYDVQLVMVNGYTDTIISPHKFTVKEEVTF